MSKFLWLWLCTRLEIYVDKELDFATVDAAIYTDGAIAATNNINTTPKLYRDRQVCPTTRQGRMGQDGHGRSSK